MNYKRILLAAVIAPLIVPFLYLVGMLLFSGYTSQGPGHMEKLIELTLRGIIPLSYLASFMSGLPIVALLKWWGRLTTLNCVVLAAAVGAIGGYLVAVLFSGPGGFQPSIADLFLAVLGSFVAAITAIVFCVFAGTPMRSPRTSD